MKQETLEEAATIEGLYRCSQHNFNQAEAGYNAKWFKRGALFGAKWQQNKIDIFNARMEKERAENRAFLELHRQERSYSEEDLRNAFDSAREFDSLDGIVDVHIVLPMGGDMSDLQPLHFTFDEWFEQFKKK